MLGNHTGVVGKAKASTSLFGHLKLTIKSFARNRDGNIFFLFAFMTTVLFLFAGGAVDYTRWNAVRADMTESMDAASLALAQLSSSDPDKTDAELKAYGRKFFEANFNYESDLEPGWNIEFGLDNNAVIITCITGNIKTYLLGVAGIHNLDIGKCVEITKKGSGRVELALVLDVTGSMGSPASGDSEDKIERLKDAVETMLDVMYGDDETSDNIKIGVVPFNAYVNPGAAASWSNDWADTGADAHYHGARFFHVDESGNIDLSTKVNHFTLYDSMPNVSWAGCVESRPYPLDELDLEPDDSYTISEINDFMDIPSDYVSSTDPQDMRNYDAFDDAPSYAVGNSVLTAVANSKWVPQFHPDEPDCDANDDCEDSNYSESGTTASGIPWFGYRFDDPDNDDIHNPDYDIAENAYRNRNFIDDWRYTRYDQGAPFNKYARIVHYFRELLGDTTPPSILYGDSRDDDFKQFLNDLTVHTGLDSGESEGHGRGRQEYIMRNAYVGWWDTTTSTYLGKYDLPATTSGSVGPDRGCPDPILPLTNVRDDIETYVNTLSADGYTNSANGAAWGWRILSPEAPFEEGIAEGEPDFEKWQKAIVIMTDGENTIEDGEPWGSDDNSHWNSGLGTSGYAIESRMGANMDDRDDMRDDIDNKLLRVCHRMKEEGYLVYTIMFGLESTSTENVFKACATRPSTPYFHDAADGDDLEEAFGEIAADLVNLHISK